jgi:hypothetical protein
MIDPSDIPLMAAEDVLNLMRDATEDDVARVVPRLIDEGAMLIGIPHVDLLELFNRMIDELTGERAAAEEGDDAACVALAARLKDASGEG